MEWEVKVKLATYLNKGESENACELVLNNDMDLQAWDMFLTGMDLRDYEAYKPLLPKIEDAKVMISQNLGLREILRMNALIIKLLGTTDNWEE